VYGAGKLVGVDDMRRVTRGLAGLGGAITLANVLASANYSSPDKRLSPEVMAGREFHGDTDLTELSSGES
jgi:hypothetical protein